jgi:hypothetical protein
MTKKKLIVSPRDIMNVKGWTVESRLVKECLAFAYTSEQNIEAAVAHATGVAMVRALTEDEGWLGSYTGSHGNPEKLAAYTMTLADALTKQDTLTQWQAKFTKYLDQPVLGLGYNSLTSGVSRNLKGIATPCIGSATFTGKQLVYAWWNVDQLRWALAPDSLDFATQTSNDEQMLVTMDHLDFVKDRLPMPGLIRGPIVIFTPWKGYMIGSLVQNFVRLPG